MASVTNLPSGRRMLQFHDREGIRRTIRLGKVSKLSAKTIGDKVDEYVGLLCAGLPINRELGNWINELSPKLHDKFVAAGLFEPRTIKEPALLGTFLDGYIDSLTRKPNTIEHLQRARTNLTDFFDEKRALESIKPGDADAFRRHLEGTMDANSTVPRICGRAKQFFRAAEREG